MRLLHTRVFLYLSRDYGAQQDEKTRKMLASRESAKDPATAQKPSFETEIWQREELFYGQLASGLVLEMLFDKLTGASCLHAVARGYLRYADALCTIYRQRQMLADVSLSPAVRVTQEYHLGTLLYHTRQTTATLVSTTSSVTTEADSRWLLALGRRKLYV